MTQRLPHVSRSFLFSKLPGTRQIFPRFRGTNEDVSFCTSAGANEWYSFEYEKSYSDRRRFAVECRHDGLCSASFSGWSTSAGWPAFAGWPTSAASTASSAATNAPSPSSPPASSSSASATAATATNVVSGGWPTSSLTTNWVPQVSILRPGIA